MNSYFNCIDIKMLDAKLKTKTFPFSQYLFWDTPIDSIDVTLHKKYIIERVLTKGFLQDFYLLQNLYSKNDIKIALKKSKVLDAKTANFCSHYFDIPITELHVSSYYS